MYFIMPFVYAIYILFMFVLFGFIIIFLARISLFSLFMRFSFRRLRQTYECLFHDVIERSVIGR